MTGTDVFFDTWAWFEIVRKSPRGPGLWKSYGGNSNRIHTSILSIAEIAAKLHAAGYAAEAKDMISFVEANSRLHGITADHARRAGPIRQELRQTRPGASIVDALIVACAEELAMPRISGDRAILGRPGARDK